MTQRTGYHDTWTDTRRANASFLVQSGTLDGLHDMHRGIVTEIQPEAIAAANGIRDSTGALSAQRRRSLAGRQRPAGAEQQHHALGDLQPRLQPDRVGCGAGDAQRAVRALLPGEAALLPGEHRVVQRPQPADLHPAGRGPDLGRQGDGQRGAAVDRLPGRRGRDRRSRRLFQRGAAPGRRRRPARRWAWC